MEEGKKSKVISHTKRMVLRNVPLTYVHTYTQPPAQTPPPNKHNDPDPHPPPTAGAGGQGVAHD